MSRLFISHSSLQNAHALALSEWLSSNGYADHFLDLRDLLPGQYWQDEFIRQGEACRSVLLMVSPAWLSSAYCRLEGEIALRYDKTIFVCVVEPGGDLPPRLAALQRADLSGEPKASFRVEHDGQVFEAALSVAGLEDLKRGLQRCGLFGETFRWPPDGDPWRSPYPGLRPLDAADAAVYFGREALRDQVIAGVERLAGEPGLSVMAIVGASGTGKSSFMRAAVLPRLERRLGFAVVPTVRLGASLPADLIARVRQHRTASGDARALVLSLDQAEELFRPEFEATAEAFVKLLAAIPGTVILVLAMRSDSLSRLQARPWFYALPVERQVLQNFAQLPTSDYRSVITGPALVHSENTASRIEIQPALVDRLLEDMKSGADPLPLLALTLQSLCCPLHEGGLLVLDVAAYERTGGLSQVLVSVIEKALANPDREPALAPPGKGREQDLERLFPCLAKVDPDNAEPVRRKATTAEIDTLPVTARAVVKRLVEARILSQSDRTFEFSHEAVLRHWPALTFWLGNRRQPLRVVQQLQQAAEQWRTSERSVQYLTLRGSRIAEARRAVATPGLGIQLGATDTDFLGQCASQQQRERLRQGAGVLLFVVVVSIAGFAAKVIGDHPDMPARYAWYVPVLWTIGLPVAETTFVKLPAGIFRAGCDPERDSFGANTCEGLWPAAAVEIEGDFELGEDEVTYEQFDRYVFESRAKPYPEGKDATRRHPVAHVTPAQAAAYARWLSERSGGRYTYSLPTSRQWEYAARGGAQGRADVGPFGWGAETPARPAACMECDPSVQVTSETGVTSLMTKPVASYPAYLGFHDLHGNVSEWVTSPAAPGGYWTRGGNIYSDLEGLRTAIRPHESRGQSDDVGFRLSRRRDHALATR